MDTPPLFIVGAGIAGLATSLALRNHEAEIFEQARAFSPLGAGLQLGPNAVRALRKLRAWDAVEPVTSSPPEIHIRDGITGKILKRLPLGKYFESRYGSPYRVALRADLHTALLGLVNQNKSHRIAMGVAISELTVHSKAIELDVNGRKRTSHAVIITDGVQSTLRRNLFPHIVTQSTGETHHRALITSPKTSGIDLACVNLWMLPHGHVVHYLVGQESLLNLVVVAPEATKTDELIKNACTPLQELIERATPHFTQWQAFVAPALHSWTKGNALMLGDAAHGTVPYMAQGAAMALEDAACLSDVVASTNSWHDVFAETANRRMRRTTRLHHQSLAAGRTYHYSGVLRLVRNAVLAKMPNRIFMRQLDWLYKG
jgi:salicylate hydroxylase